MSIIVTSRLEHPHNTRSITMLKKYHIAIKHTINVVCTEKKLAFKTFQNVNKVNDRKSMIKY